MHYPNPCAVIIRCMFNVSSYENMCATLRMTIICIVLYIDFSDRNEVKNY